MRGIEGGGCGERQASAALPAAALPPPRPLPARQRACLPADRLLQHVAVDGLLQHKVLAQRLIHLQAGGWGGGGG